MAFGETPELRCAWGLRQSVPQSSSNEPSEVRFPAGLRFCRQKQKASAAAGERDRCNPRPRWFSKGGSNGLLSFFPLPAAKRSAEPHILCRNRGLDFVPFGFPKSTKPKRVPFHKRAKHHKLPVRLVSVEPIERPFRSLHRGRSESLVHGVFLGSGISNQGLEESKIRFISFDYS